MNDLIKAQENANKVANIIKDLDKSDQQRAIDIVTSFALGVQSRNKQINKNEDYIKGD